jgi:hypothetical protein
MVESRDVREGIESMPHVGVVEVLRLRGPSAQILRTQKRGPIAIQWAPVDRGALEVELRAQPLMTSFGSIFDAGKIPVISYTLDYGHGVYTWTEPRLFQAPQTGVSTPLEPWTLPARGMVLRLAVREWKITFRCDGSIDGTTVDANTIAVSFQPVYTVEPPRVPRTTFHRVVVPAVACALPMAADEMRVRDKFGQPIAPGVTSIQFFSLAIAGAGTADVSAYKDFQPIPIHAVGFQLPGGVGADTAVQVDYR